MPDSALAGKRGDEIVLGPGSPRNPLISLESRKEMEGNGRGFRGFGSFRLRTWRALAASLKSPDAMEAGRGSPLGKHALLEREPLGWELPFGWESGITP